MDLTLKEFHMVGLELKLKLVILIVVGVRAHDVHVQPKSLKLGLLLLVNCGYEKHVSNEAYGEND